MQMGHWIIGGCFDEHNGRLRGWVRMSNQTSLVHFDLEFADVRQVEPTSIFFESEPFTALTSAQLTRWASTSFQGYALFDPEYQGVVQKFEIALAATQSKQSIGSLMLSFTYSHGAMSISIPRAYIDTSPLWETEYL